jgi:hypothetical protein
MFGKELSGYLSMRQTAQALNITKTGVLYLMETGELAPVYFIDGFYLIPEETLLRFQNQRTGIKDGRYKIK